MSRLDGGEHGREPAAAGAEVRRLALPSQRRALRATFPTPSSGPTISNNSNCGSCGLTCSGMLNCINSICQ
jgi:hypothetical protein